MKQVLLAKNGGVVRFVDSPPQDMPSSRTWAELTDVQAAEVEASTEPLYLFDGILHTRAQIRAMSPAAVVEVPLWRLRAAAKAAGIFESIEAVIAGLPDGPRYVAEEAWNHGNVLNSKSPVLQGLAKAVGLSEKEVEGLFRSAADLNV